MEVSAREFVFSGRPAVLEVVQDLSDQRRLEMELREAQWLESVGQLAAGIAHEINTPIQYVGDNLRFIQDAFGERQLLIAAYQELHRAAESGALLDSPLAKVREATERCDLEYLAEEIPKALSQSADGVERVATIVRAMKEFAHPGSAEKAAADINRALANTLMVAKNQIKYVADVKTEYGAIPPAICNIGEMNQVFLNLLVNAAHAIEEANRGSGKRGEIAVRTRCAGNMLEIAISDTGCGIPESIRSRVFDPFFTTKEVGRGTGQGLAIARSIVVERHHGSIRFEPNGGQGTTFVVTIPLDSPQPGVTD